MKPLLSLTCAGSSNWRQLKARLSDYDQVKFLRRFRSKLVSGTTTWFLKHETLQMWMADTKASTLWLCGEGMCDILAPEAIPFDILMMSSNSWFRKDYDLVLIS